MAETPQQITGTGAACRFDMQLASVAFRISEQIAHDGKRIGQIVPVCRFNRNIVVGQRDTGAVLLERFQILIQQDAVEP